MRHPIKRKNSFRLLSALLIFALGLPTSSAHALRPSLEGKVQSGLEEVLHPASSGLEELADQIQKGIREIVDGHHVIPFSDYPDVVTFRDQGEFDKALLGVVRHMKPDQLAKAIQNLLAWMEGPLGMEDLLDVWIQPENHERFLVAAIQLVSLLKVNRGTSERVENLIFRGLLSKEFLQASFEIDPVVFERVISHSEGISSDAELHAFNTIIDKAPADRRLALREVYRLFQAPLVAEVPTLKQDEQATAENLPQRLPVAAYRIFSALRAVDNEQARFWTERIHPDAWRDNPQVNEMVQWMSQNPFPLKTEDLARLLSEFADKGLQVSLFQIAYPSVGPAAVMAAFQELLKPETREAVQRVLLAPDDNGKAHLNSVQRELSANEQVPGIQLPNWQGVPRNPYGDVLFYRSLPADYRQQFSTYREYLEALYAARLAFYQSHRDEVAPPAAGLEEVLSGEEARRRFAEIRQSFVQGTPVRGMSVRLSATMMGLLRHVEKEAVVNLQTKIPVLIDFGDGTSRVTAYAPGDSKLNRYPQVEYAGKDYFIVATGSLGRQDDFVLGSDADFVVFPSNPKSVAYAQALQTEMTEVLGNTLEDQEMDFKIDKIMTAAYDFQVPPEQVLEKLLVPALLSFDNRIDSMVLAPSITSYVFRDMVFLSGNREGFDRLSGIAAPVLYPYGTGEGEVNSQGLKLIEKLQAGLREFGRVSMDTSRPERIDLKEDLLRPVQMAVWLMRARQGIRSASVFEALSELQARGVNRSGELARAYEFMLLAKDILYDLRGRTTVVLPTQKSDYRIPEQLQPALAQRMGLKLPDFLQQFKLHADAIRSIVSQQLTGLEEVRSSAPFPAGLEPDAQKAIHRRIEELARRKGPDLQLSLVVDNFRLHLNPMLRQFARTLSTEENDLFEDIKANTATGRPRPTADRDALLEYVYRAYLTGGLEEQQAAWRAASELADGFRSRSAVDSRSVVVIGRDLAQRIPGLQVLSGLEERVVIDREDLSDTLARAAQLGDTVYFYGDPQRGAGLEELAGRSGLSLSFVLRNPGEDSKIMLVLRQIFEDLGIPSADISAGLEEFTRSVEGLGQAA